MIRLFFLAICTLCWLTSVHCGDDTDARKDDQLTPACVDLSSVCTSWANYCQKLPDGTFQKQWCPRTCNKCNGVTLLADAAPLIQPVDEFAQPDNKGSPNPGPVSIGTSISTESSSGSTISTDSSSTSTSTIASSISTDSSASTDSSTSSSTSSSSSSSAISSNSLGGSSNVQATNGPSFVTLGLSAVDLLPKELFLNGSIPLPSQTPPPLASPPVPLQVEPFPGGQAPNGPFPGGQAPNGQFPGGQAPNGPFPTGQAPNAQFGQGPLPLGQPPLGPAPNALGQPPLGQSPLGQSPLPALNSSASSARIPELFVPDKPYQCNADFHSLIKLNGDISDMAIKLYKRAVEDTPKENIVFSPVAIALGLGVMEIGAKGVALQEIHNAIVPSFTFEEAGNSFAALITSLRGTGQIPSYRLNLVNALYVDKNFPVNNDFESSATKCFNVKTQQMDFQRKSDPSRLEINEWVTEHTDYKIKNLFPPAAIDSDDRLVMVNLAYLFAEWANSFTNGRTYNRLFYPPNNAPGVEVPMMSMEGRFRYWEEADIKVLGIDYKEKELTMFFFLPTNREGLAQFERTLDAKELNRLMNWPQEQEVDVTIPKFAINYRFNMKQALKTLGVRLLFDISGDMSGLSRKRDLYSTNAVHQAYIKVAERGTEESYVANEKPTQPNRRAPRRFVAEHSFICAIRHSDSEQLLYLGRVINPTKSD